MKKIFTLVFSLGLLTSAFAQSGHRQQNQNTGNTHQQSQYSHDNSQYNNGANTYSYSQNSQWNKNDSHDQYASNRDNDKFSRDRNFGGSHERFDSRYQKEKRNYDFHPRPVRVPLLQIILGIGKR
ncbi:MAG TPA: hypothetical protein VIJ92_05010 [Ginsengibacter sp.]